ncbi:MAG TPA: D-alanyl-D-alanine carboxypeptidase/D-alanyl-D-alanine-endopeptidase [Betaproteobacteria bacterium]|nr:D-alanyl-D-alanine carboxypeptidase/D-alanyl-D-alanine-endopeptidase [Betaproteobacteria bacterium]
MLLAYRNLLRAFRSAALVAAGGLGIATPLPAAPLPTTVIAALREANISLKNIGVYVQNVNAAQPLLDYRGRRPMDPASTMKLLTTAAALEQLGPDFTWKTEAYADGPIKNGVLQGNLYLKGYGDPLLTLERFWMLLRQLRQAGVRVIRGNLVLDKRYFHVPYRDPATFDDEPYKPYNAAPNALTVNFRVTEFRFLPEPARRTVRIVADPRPDGVRVINRLRLTHGACGAWRERLKQRVLPSRHGMTVLFDGRYAAACGEKSAYLRLYRNGGYVYSVFKQLWKTLGGVLNGALREGATPANATWLATANSPPLAVVERSLNKYSNNFMARQLFLTLGAETAGPPGLLENARQAVRRWLRRKGLHFPSLVMENGAGLSRTARITPQDLAAVLLAMHRSPFMPEYISTLPIAAVDGTMKKRLSGTPAASHAHIKTGTLDGVKAIAGYVRSRDGGTWSVAFLINDPHASAGAAAGDALLEWIYDYPPQRGDRTPRSRAREKLPGLGDYR